MEEKGAEHAIVSALSFAKFYIYIFICVLKFLCPLELETREARYRYFV